MSYNGSGTFQINTAGQPVVTGTVISSTAFNSLTSDLATGLSTAITKDGQTTTTARIPFAEGINSSLTTDSSSTSTGSIITAGGVGIAKALYVGTNANVAGTLAVTGLTASSAVATDASKNLVSVTNTGTGNNVLATGPTLVTPALGTPASGIMTNVTGINYDGFKNRIINGAMAISQRGTSFTTGAGSAYMVDRWQVGATQVSKITGTQSTTTTTGFTYSQGLTVASAFSSGAGDLFYLTQGIEGFNIADLGWGTANASPITISFWIRGSLTGTYSAFVRNSARNRSYIATFTINSANTFEQKTVTIPGDTSGTWATDNTEGINFGIDLGSGTNYNGTASTWTGSNVFRTSGSVSWVANSSATLFLTGVQIEKGSTATSFDYRPYGTELALCQRYCEVWGGDDANEFFATGFSPSTSNALCMLPFKTTKRAAPSITSSTVSDFCVFNNANTAQTLTSLSFSQISKNACRANGGVAGTPISQAQGNIIGANNTTNARIYISAEL